MTDHMEITEAYEQARRRAVPWAIRCAPCQTAKEGKRP